MPIPQGYEKPPRLKMLLDMPPASKELQYQHAWNPDDRSPNITVKEDRLTCRRRKLFQFTDCIRGKVGYTSGLHVWEFHWPRELRGTHAVVGVATADAPLHSPLYLNLVGENDRSWGWDIIRNQLCHDTDFNPCTKYPFTYNPYDSYWVPDVFYGVLDMDEGTLSFIVENGIYLGVAFKGLKGKKLYPIINTVYGDSEIKMTYIGGFESKPLPLTSLCRWVIRQQLGEKRLEKKISKLGLPRVLEMFLAYKGEGE